MRGDRIAEAMRSSERRGDGFAELGGFSRYRRLMEALQPLPLLKINIFFIFFCVFLPYFKVNFYLFSNLAMWAIFNILIYLLTLFRLRGGGNMTI